MPVTFLRPMKQPKETDGILKIDENGESAGELQFYLLHCSAADQPWPADHRSLNARPARAITLQDDGGRKRRPSSAFAVLVCAEKDNTATARLLIRRRDPGGASASAGVGALVVALYETAMTASLAAANAKARSGASNVQAATKSRYIHAGLSTRVLNVSDDGREGRRGRSGARCQRQPQREKGSGRPGVRSPRNPFERSGLFRSLID